jgi:hypothetical protein
VWIPGSCLFQPLFLSDCSDIEIEWETLSHPGCHSPVTPVSAGQMPLSDRLTGVTAQARHHCHTRKTADEDPRLSGHVPHTGPDIPALSRSAAYGRLRAL